MINAKLSFLLTILCHAVAVAGELPNQLSLPESATGWTLIFDGQSTAGWRNYGSNCPQPGWEVVDGTLTSISGSTPGCELITGQEYDSFELLFDYRVEPDTEAAVMFHVVEREGVPASASGPQIRITDSVSGKIPATAGTIKGVYHSLPSRPNYIEPDRSRSGGEWNQIYLRVSPENCQLLLNGYEYLTFQLGSPEWRKRVAAGEFAQASDFAKAGRGHLGLQCFQGQVSFRDIMVRTVPLNELPERMASGSLPVRAEPAFPDIAWPGWEPVNEDGLARPFRGIVVTHAPDDSNRLFIADQWGVIWSVQNSAEVKEAKRFLDLRDRVVEYRDKREEEGFLGLAFHPKFAENGSFYVYYTHRPERISYLSRYQVSKADPSVADPDSETVLMVLEQPWYNHNGGTLEFGPDGYLYIGLGDGGPRNDPYGHAQNRKTLLGSILRIDVDHPTEGKPYGIPADNPFVNKPDLCPEIYAYGFRNVWRLGFDRLTGDLWSNDIGQNLWEEINFVKKGGNYGWSGFEGTHPFGAIILDSEKVIPPVWEYDHQVGKSAIGGFVYRGKAIPELYGKYLFTDYVTGRIYALTFDRENQKVTRCEQIPWTNIPILSFGEDEAGEAYFTVVSTTGQVVYKLVRE